MKKSITGRNVLDGMMMTYRCKNSMPESTIHITVEMILLEEMVLEVVAVAANESVALIHCHSVSR